MCFVIQRTQNGSGVKDLCSVKMSIFVYFIWSFLQQSVRLYTGCASVQLYNKNAIVMCNSIVHVKCTSYSYNFKNISKLHTFIKGNQLKFVWSQTTAITCYMTSLNCKAKHLWHIGHMWTNRKKEADIQMNRSVLRVFLLVYRQNGLTNCAVDLLHMWLMYWCDTSSGSVLYCHYPF